MRLTEREIATIRASLDSWKDKLLEGVERIMETHDFREHSPLSREEVDDVRQRLEPREATAAFDCSPPAWKMLVPTYFGSQKAQTPEESALQEFGLPLAPLLISEAEGIRVVLGTHDYNDRAKPDVQIERRPKGWAIFIHPNAGDPVASVYILDNGRTFLLPESYFTDNMQITDDVPADLDKS